MTGARPYFQPRPVVMIARSRARKPLPSAPTRTVRTVLADAHARLKRANLVYGHGTTNPWDEAVYLVLHALRLPLDDLTRVLARQVTPAENDRALALVHARIKQRLPSPYLTHEAWLGDLRFYVDRRVLVPRSFISELLRNRLAPWLVRPTAVRRALDLCTGSGCLAVQLALTFPRAYVDASDISRAALAVARRNVNAYGLNARITLRKSDMFKALRGRTYDLIVANPPYVNARAMRALPHEYRHEPQLALAGGEDGFDAVHIILRRAADHLTDNGLLVVEVGHYRRELEAAFPWVPFVWPQTSGGDDNVFILERQDLLAVKSTRPRQTRHRAMPATARSRRR